MLLDLPKSSDMLRTLEQYNHCSRHSRLSDEPIVNGLDVDHVFNQMAGRKHRRVLSRDLMESHENKTRVCKDCHRGIDGGSRGKLSSFRNHGLWGLIEFNAVYYPRPKDENLQEVMYYQWRVLFMRLRDSLRSMKEEYPPHQMADYTKALSATEFHLDQWEVGPDRFLRTPSPQGRLFLL